MIVYTDGSWIPGQTGYGYAGIGIWFGQDDIRNTSIPLHHVHVSNQVAELTAIYYALKFCESTDKLLVKTDSQYSIKCLTIWHNKWERNSWKNSKNEDVANSTLIKDILAMISARNRDGYMTSFQHVYGHKDDIGNIGADKLATMASSRVESRVMDTMIYFYSHTHGEYKCFSQFYPCTFTMTYDDKVIEYNCVEQHHHQQKAVMFADTKSEQRIMSTSDPGAQKRYGRRVMRFDNGVWLESCYEICRRSNIAKFSQNQDLLQILLSTKGRHIAEASQDDCVWGIGLSAAQSRSRVKWKGKNLLGKVLVDIRDNVFA